MTKKQKKTRNRILIVLAMFVVLLILDKTGMMEPVPWFVQFVIYLIAMNFYNNLFRNYI